MIEQRNDQWFAARCGLITASNFFKCMTNPKTKKAKDDGELSETAKTFMDEVVAEMDSGIPIEKGQTTAMKWGNDWEDSARDEAIEVLSEKFGRNDFHPAFGENAFIVHPKYPGFGCSPDFLVGEDALGELKCPYNGGRHVTSCLSTAAWFLKEHGWQIMGGLWVTGRQKYYCATYNPRSKARPLEMVTIERNEKAIQELETRLLAFRSIVLNRLAQFRRQPF